MNPAAPSQSAFGSGVDEQNPWPGLVAFTEELQDFFHGRLDEADDLLRRVGRKNLTVLFGQSGLGKSSLLQAGLFPRLRAEGYLPVPIRLDHAASSPPLSEQVTGAVTRAILEAGGRSDAPPSDKPATLWEHFHSRSLILETAKGRPVRPVFVFDQFEELFAIGQASEATRKRAQLFLSELADLVENRAPAALELQLENSPELVKQFIFDDRDYRILVCLREDYLAQLEGLRHSMPSITENRMRLTRMNGTRALEAVTKPGGDLLSTEVGCQIVRFVAGERPAHHDAMNDPGHHDGLLDLEVEPSLLSLVCRELNNQRMALGLPQITADLVAGNRERILNDFYERCVSDQPLGGACLRRGRARDRFRSAREHRPRASPQIALPARNRPQRHRRSRQAPLASPGRATRHSARRADARRAHSRGKEESRRARAARGDSTGRARAA